MAKPESDDDLPSAAAGVPDARAAASALRSLDAAQLAIVRILPDRLAGQVIRLLPLVGGGFYVSSAFGDTDRGHDVGLVIGAAFYLAGALGGVVVMDREKSAGVSGTPMRFRRTGRTTDTYAFVALLLVAVFIALGTDDAWAAAPFVVIAVAVQAWFFVQQGADEPRDLVPLRWCPKPNTFYDEFLDPDVLRVSGALALVNAARPTVLAAPLGLDPVELRTAVGTLDRLGYVDWKGKDDGRGQRAKLNYHGRRAYRHHLAALEQTAGSAPRALLQTA